MPFRYEGLCGFCRIKLKISACALRTNLFRLFTVIIIRFMTITVALLGIFFFMNFMCLEIFLRCAFMDSRARNASRVNSNFLLFRSISRIIFNLFVRFGKINVNVARRVANGLSDRALRARASARYQGIIFTNMFNDGRFAFSAT